MFKKSTFMIFIGIVTLFLLILIAASFMHWDNVVLMPALSIYFFSAMGIPGLLDQNDACGSAFCAPTTLGYFFTVSVWMLGLWLLAAVISGSSTAAKPPQDL